MTLSPIVVVDPIHHAAPPDLGDDSLRVDRRPAAEVLATTGADVVVMLAGDVTLPPGWLAGLMAPFDDDNVAVVGPVSNAAPPGQRVVLGEAAAMDAAVEAWAAAHRGEVHAAPRVASWCWAVRTTAARAVGGLVTGEALEGIEVDDLCRRLACAGYEIVVAEDVYVVRPAEEEGCSSPADSAREEIEHLINVARAGRRDLLVSAALIVKNEEANLPRCLASLGGVVDEVVVYDTGSTDRTVEIAREAGAVVVEGYWDDDFSRARNDAISACRGEWVLSIDADEVATGDPSAVRCALEVNWAVDLMVVQITNVLGTGQAVRAGLDHQAPRLLRRSRCRWRFRLHEQPFTPAGGPPMRAGRFTQLRLLHTGYTDDAASAHDKVERNIRVAEEGMAELVDPDPSELAANLVNLGRSYTWAGRNEDALRCYERAIVTDSPVGYRRTALTHGFEALMALGRLDEAEDWLEKLRALSSETNLVPRYLEGLLLFRRGDITGALDRLNGIGALDDDDGTARGAEFVAKARGMAQLANQDWVAALESLMVAATSGAAPAWGPMTIAAACATGDVGMVAALVTDDHLLAACAETVTSVPDLAPAFLEALWSRFTGDARLLAAAARLGPALGIGRALEWSARLRAAGSAERCPLRAIVAADTADTPGTASAGERLRAAAVLESAFGEPCPPEVLDRLAAAVGEGERHAVAEELSQLCPRIARALAPRLSRQPA